MKKRKETSVDEEVTDHYNARPVVDYKRRKESEIFRLKTFNNWIKSVLINSYVKQNDVVLDMGCGKGGDLLKWQKSKVSKVLCVDVAENSVKEAQTRYENMRHPEFEAKFTTVDCFKVPLVYVLEELGFTSFDVVSAQFCIHYAFETETKVRQALKNISDALEEGGYFLGTLPDASVLKEKLKETVGLRFGNAVYKVKFESRDESDYGRMYWFELKESIDNCPEFLVDLELFKT